MYRTVVRYISGCSQFYEHSHTQSTEYSIVYSSNKPLIDSAGNNEVDGIVFWAFYFTIWQYGANEIVYGLYKVNTQYILYIQVKHTQNSSIIHIRFVGSINKFCHFCALGCLKLNLCLNIKIIITFYRGETKYANKWVYSLLLFTNINHKKTHILNFWLNFVSCSNIVPNQENLFVQGKFWLQVMLNKDLIFWQP